MGKKLQSEPRWKNYIRGRQSSQLRNARRKNRRTGRPSHPPYERSAFWPLSFGPFFQRQRGAAKGTWRDVTAPETFSLLLNPGELIEFLNRTESVSRTHNLNIDLSRVSTITTDAIVALLATMERVPGPKRGNLPRLDRAREILVQSGFFNHVKITERLPQVLQGLIFQEQAKKVAPDAAQLLVQRGTEIISGTPRKCQPAFRTLIEAMSNTHNHASAKPEELERWWAMVYGDTVRKRACFTFVDTGVGIFQTVELDVLRKLYKFVAGGDAKILREILEGKVESSTGVSYRGKGLPAMYEHQRAGRIHSLTIISNGVFANVANNDFRNLEHDFHGTLIYWEIE